MEFCIKSQSEMEGWRLKSLVLQSHYRSGWKQSGNVRWRVLLTVCCSLSLHLSKSSMGWRAALWRRMQLSEKDRQIRAAFDEQLKDTLHEEE